MKNAQQHLEILSPNTDIFEVSDGFHIVMDLPGVSREALRIDAHGDQIAVSGKSAYESSGQCLHKEHQPVEYSRVFTVSDTVDREHIEASLKNGVLDLFLPKAKAVSPRRIEIKTL